MDSQKPLIELTKSLEEGAGHLAECATNLEIAKTFGCTPELLELWHMHSWLTSQQSMLLTCLQEDASQEWIIIAAKEAAEFQRSAKMLRKRLQEISSNSRTKALLEVSDSGEFDLSDTERFISELTDDYTMSGHLCKSPGANYVVSRDLFGSDVTFDLSPISPVFNGSPVESLWDSWSLGAVSISPCESLESESSSQCTAGRAAEILSQLGSATSTSQELQNAYMVKRARELLAASIPPDDAMEC